MSLRLSQGDPVKSNTSLRAVLKGMGFVSYNFAVTCYSLLMFAQSHLVKQVYIVSCLIICFLSFLSFFLNFFPAVWFGLFFKLFLTVVLELLPESIKVIKIEWASEACPECRLNCLRSLAYDKCSFK